MAEVMEDEQELGARSQRWKHQGQLEWMAENFGYDYDEMDALEIVTAFALHRVPWRRSDEYAQLVEDHRTEQEEAREARKAERAEAAAARAAEKEAAEAEKPAKAPAAKKAAKAAKPATKATAKGGKATATRKATGARKGGKASKAGANPFG